LAVLADATVLTGSGTDVMIESDEAESIIADEAADGSGSG
jgi:hypothetical protein